MSAIPTIPTLDAETSSTNNSNKKKKFIIFDMGGVLLSADFNGCVKEIFNQNLQTFQQVPLQVPLQQVPLQKEETFQETLQKEEEENKEIVTIDLLLETIKKQFSSYKNGKINEDEFWNIFFKAPFYFGNCKFNGEQLTLENLKEIFRNYFLIPFYNGLGFAEEIRNHQKRNKTNLSIGIMSNHSKEWFPYCWNRWRFGDIFTEPLLILNSADDDIQCGKPNELIYDILIKRIKNSYHHNESFEINDIVFIDDKQANVDVALKKGMKGICWHGKKQTIKELIVQLKELNFIDFDI
ncbi:hypothetical protein ABK040_007062 [Willaertia magna]